MRERERDRGEERAREGDRGEGDPHSTPSLPTRTLLYALRDPRGGERSDYRLPPTFSLSLSLLRLSFSLSLSPWHLILSYHRALVSCHLGPLPLFSTRLHDPTPTNLLLLLLSSTFPSRSHFRFNVGQLSRRAAGCANAADKRVFTRCR